jgi:uncharacterized protein YfaS (alpha-2-macroglobulin family)
MRQILFVVVAVALFGIAPARPEPNRAAPPRGVLGVYVRGPSTLQAGTPAALRIAAHWASSESESGPYPGVDVEVRLAGGGRKQLLARGRSDGAGLVDARFTVPDWPDGEYTLSVDAQAGARHDSSEQKISIAPSARLLLESDKPLYQPAQVIHLRAIGMRPLDGKPLATGEVTFVVSDPRGNEVFRENRALSRFGVAAADFALADEILTGGYRARVERPGAQPSELALTVERYQLPKFKVDLATDKSWYRPGDPIAISLDARYFFGKPVAGGRAAVTLTIHGSSGVRTQLAKLTGKLDADGKLTLHAELPSRALPSESPLVTLSAEVTDAAEHREKGARELPLSAEGAQLELTGENPALVPGASNRVYLAATRPDGAPITNAAVELRVDGKPSALATDAIGVAQLAITPALRRGCVDVVAALRHDGIVSTAHRCLPLAPNGTLVVRPDRAIYPLGAAMTVELAGLGADGPVYLDVVKDAQTVDTQRVWMKGGKGAVTLLPDGRRFGTLALEAYRIAPDGTQQRASRVVYVERPSALRIDVKSEATYRPGEPGRIRLHVVDAQSGKGAAAQLGVVMVDQSLLALKSIKPGAARIYFSLADEATRPQLKLAVKPAGYTVERIIEEGQLDALKDEAAQILLAGAQPPWSQFEHDPWRARKEAFDAQLPRIGEKLARWAPEHLAGERVRGAHWRWRRDLLTQMISDGALAQKDAHDPWGRRIAADKALEYAGLGEFDAWATQQVEQRLTRIYVALAREGLDRTLPLDQNPKRGRVLTLADVEKLAAAGKLPKWLLTDPWGQPWRIAERKRPITVARLRSRFLLASAGPDGVVDNKDDLYAIDSSWGRDLDELRVMAAERSVAFGDVGRLGLIGRGMGAGGGGAGYGSIGMGRMGTIGHGGGSGEGSGEARVRRDFPETMLWLPQLDTDANGDATIDVTMADSITTWRLFAEAIATDGRLGATSADVRVFQDFFVDLDLPPVVTQHDELAVPVAVYNYLTTPQRVTLTLDDGRWFARAGEAVQSIDLQPSQVGVRYFRIKIGGVGRQKLLVRAKGSAASDAIEKSIEIRPDGVERAVAFQDRLDPGAVQHRFTLPDNAIADASLSNLKIYPSTVTHVIEGLDSMLRMPGGCFEQTSSSTYPNALILDYLRKTKKATPEVEKKAKEYLAAGWQRLLSFEVPGGGFSWFGQAPANQVLTAYGIEEFSDMARVMTIDKRVLERTQAWLAGKQRSDGSWAPDTSFINEGATTHFNSDTLRITAYIAGALQHTGYRGPAVDRARAYVKRALDDKAPRDAYTLALVAELLASDASAPLDALLDQLWRERSDDGKTASFASKEKTLTYGDGKSGTVETTARVAHSLLVGHAPSARVERAIGYLLGAKDTFGNWYSTQATILSLRALLDFGGSAKPARGRVTVLVDGRDAGHLDVDAAKLALATLDLPALTRAGAHGVELRFDGAGQLAYQLVDRWYEPRAAAATSASELEIATRLDKTRVKPGDTVVERVRVESMVAIDMPIVTAGVPPGFDVDGEELDALVRAHTVDKVQRTPAGVVLYLTKLSSGTPFELTLHLRARFPEAVQVPPASVYEYYRPERKAVGAPLLVTVAG